MNLKAGLSFALAAIFALSAFAACGESPSASSAPETDAGTAAAVTEAGPETTTDYFSVLPDDDQGGRTFTIVAHHTAERFNFAYEEKTGDIINDSIIERDINVEERLNIVFSRIGYEDRAKLLADVQKAIAAGDSAYDLIITSMSAGINTLGPAGMLFDLNDLPYVDLSAAWWNRSIHEDMQIHGHQLFTTGSISPSYYLTPIVMIFNKRLAENYGFGNLYEKVYDGSWCFDNFVAMIDDLSYDLNADGKMNYEDFYAFTADTTFGNALYAAAGFSPIAVKDGAYTLQIDSQASVDMIMKCYDVFSDKNKYIITNGFPAELSDIFKSGRGVFSALYVVGFAIPYRDMEDDYGILPLPKFKESYESYNVTCNTWMPTGIAVPITCGDPEFVGLVMETLAYESYNDVGPAIYETALRGKATRDSESYEMLEFIYRDIVFDLNTIFNFGGSSELMRTAICGVTPNFVSEYAKIRDKAQKALDDMIALVETNYAGK